MYLCGKNINLFYSLVMKHFNAFLNKILEFPFLFLVIYLQVSQFEHLTQPKFRFKSPWENPVFI